MTEKIKILLVDDHHMILEGYKNVILRNTFNDLKIEIDTANSCDHAYEKIRINEYNLVLLDINFPINPDSKFLSGEDLGIWLKKEYKTTKLMILTVLEDPFRLNNILINVKPDGFLLKGETTSQELINGIEKVLFSPPYFGPKISKILLSTTIHSYSLDEKDRIILYQLSLGIKTKNLPSYVHLSLRAIENRKKRLKEIFNISGENNTDLLEKARESGYI
ncbi:MAG: response regulator [Maribacter arcticus]|uniref:response regulator n=1 Tax=Maribacter arcticus TaxID=561365 RepID=UPI003002EEFF